jgi:hypothetical protein
LALSTRITTTVGQPAGAHEGLRARADDARDVPSGATVLDGRGATGLPVSNDLTYAGAAMVFGYMESLLEEHNVGFKVIRLACLCLLSAAEACLVEHEPLDARFGCTGMRHL